MNVLERGRHFLGYTQEEMAKRLGYSRSTYVRRVRLADEYIPSPEIVYIEELVKEKAVRDVFQSKEKEEVKDDL